MTENSNSAAVPRRWALALVASVLTAHLIIVPFRSGFRQMGTDFPNYYTAAALTLKHQPLRQFYDWVWFQRQIHYSGIDHQLGAYIPHTPLTMFPLLPLTRLPPQRAKQLWIILGLVFLAASILLLSDVSQFNRLEVATLALVAHSGLSTNFLFGQYYLLILLLLAGGTWCFLRDRPFTGGALFGAIFALKLYSAPFLLYFAARRQWKALGGFVAAVATLALFAIAVFGWDAVWFFITTVMVRGLDGTVNDPYNPGWASMTAFLRRTFLSEGELNPHPLWQAPAAFFFLRAFYTVGVLGVTLVALAKDGGNEERRAIGWFIVVLFVLSPNAASYHFVLLIVAIVLLLQGESRLRAPVLVSLYVLVQLPLTSWDAPWFPKAWLLVALWLFAGWPFLRRIGRVPLGATLLCVVSISALTTAARMRTYAAEAPQNHERVTVDPGAIYSSKPVFAAAGLIYSAIGTDGYIVRRVTRTGVETFSFDGDVFGPAAAPQRNDIFLEFVQQGTSRLCEFDPVTRKLQIVALADGLNPTEPAISPDGKKLAFVSGDKLYLVEGDKRSLLRTGAVGDPSFSPDSNWVIFASGPAGRRSIEAVSTTGREDRVLVAGGDCFEPTMSPDGRRLAFACSSLGARHIWVRDLISDRSMQITRGFCGNDSPAWEAGSNSIVFASDCNRGLGLPALYRARVN